MPDVTLITPTGNRHQSFRLCEYWMRRQSYSGSVEWIVVDDGVVPTKPSCGQIYVRREPTTNDPSHTLCMNLRRVLNRVSSGRVLIIEDDDYYSPEYVSTMMKWLDKADLVGEVGAKYYFVNGCRYRVFTEHEHASLCRTGFSMKVLLLVRKLTKSDDWRLDLRLWQSWKGSRYLKCDVENGRAISVSMKGMPGRAGVTHKPAASWTLVDDRRLDKLQEWMGEDHRYYRPYLLGRQLLTEDLLVYTVCFGGYDLLKPQPQFPGVEYVAITDGDAPAPWTLIRERPLSDSPRRSSRKPKILSHEYFPGQTTLYIDANLTLRRDPRDLYRAMLRSQPTAMAAFFCHDERSNVAEEARAVKRFGFADLNEVQKQLDRYHHEGLDTLPLAWGGCIFRRPGCELFNELWWIEYQAGSERDQLSLPYALAESGVHYVLHSGACPRPKRPTLWLEYRTHLVGRLQLERNRR